MCERLPRPCHVLSHGSSDKALCHGLGITPAGRPFALVEYEGGGVNVLYLDGAYCIRFLKGSEGSA
jgi:prepilin-type processing-associated H-X9-DG protein